MTYLGQKFWQDTIGDTGLTFKNRWALIFVNDKYFFGLGPTSRLEKESWQVNRRTEACEMHITISNVGYVQAIYG